MVSSALVPVVPVVSSPNSFFRLLKTIAPKYGLHVSDKDLRVYSIIVEIFNDVSSGKISRDEAQERYKRVLYDMDASANTGAGLFAAKIKRDLKLSVGGGDVSKYVKLILINDPEMPFIIYALLTSFVGKNDASGKKNASSYTVKSIGGRLLREIMIKHHKNNTTDLYSKHLDDILVSSLNRDVLKLKLGIAVIEICSSIDVLVSIMNTDTINDSDASANASTNFHIEFKES